MCEGEVLLATCCNPLVDTLRYACAIYIAVSFFVFFYFAAYLLKLPLRLGARGDIRGERGDTPTVPKLLDRW